MAVDDQSVCYDNAELIMAQYSDLSTTKFNNILWQ